MPIKNFKNFENYFFKDGEFDKKVYEAYWNDDDQYNNNDDEDDWYDWGNTTSMNDEVKRSDMYSKINLPRLDEIGLSEYKDIVKTAIYHFESEISFKRYTTVIPSIEIIRDYIINSIGNDYTDYIPDNKLDKLSKYIYQEIDNYIYD